MENYRVVNFQKRGNTSELTPTSELKRGFFHQWIVFGSSVLALVEDEEGNINQVETNDIKFTSQYSNPNKKLAESEDSNIWTL